MIYSEGEYTKFFLKSLPEYMSSVDKQRISIDARNILSDLKKSSDIGKSLVVGQVQSGKTNALIGLSTMAVDHDYDIVIIFGGVNQLLLSQSFERIRKPFISDEYKELFVINKEDLKDETNINSYARIANNSNAKFIIITMKEVKNIRNLKILIQNLYLSDKNVLIIDDEADNASINIGKNYLKSPIYESLEFFVNNIVNGAYIGVTATPYGNLISTKSNGLYPNYIYGLVPSDEYTGLNFFKTQNIYQKVVETKKSETRFNVIKEALFTFLVNSFLMNKNSNKKFKHELLINIDLNVKSFVEIKVKIIRILNNINIRIGCAQALIDLINSFGCISDLTLKGQWKSKYNYEFIVYIQEVLQYIGNNIIILADDNSNYVSNREGLTIVIGGVLISRGFTFNNLLVEVLLNSPEDNIPADTLLQRARWFGYRKVNDRYKYMKIFMSENIHYAFEEFCKLQQILFDYIQDVNNKNELLTPEVVKEKFKGFEIIVPTKKT